MSAPTVGYARAMTTNSTARPSLGLFSRGGTTKASTSVSTSSITHTAHNDHANQAARLLALSILRSRLFAPLVTTSSLPDRPVRGTLTTLTRAPPVGACASGLAQRGSGLILLKS